MSKSKPLAFDTEMARSFVFGGSALVLVLAVAGWWMHQASRPQEAPFEPAARPVATLALCPWREPTNDLAAFFPNATGYTIETRVLSGVRLELAQRLGRTPTGDDNALRLYPVFHELTPLGAVLTRRVKGEHGGIELVLAINTNQQICGLKLQRLREPASSAAVLQDRAWLRSFDGKGVEGPWQLGPSLPEVPPDSRVSAQAIIGGVRDSLILFTTSEHQRPQRTAPHH